MKPTILLCGLLAIASPSFAQDGHSHDYNFSIFSGSEMAPIMNKGVRAETIQTARANFPGWMLSVDQYSGAFTNLYGKAMAVSGSTRVEKANQLFGKLQQLGIDKNEWQKVGDRDASHAQYVHYVRKVNGREVVFSNLSFKFTPGGELIRIRANAYGQPMQNAQATLGKAEALAGNAIMQELNGVQVSATGIDDNWVWFPVPAEKGYELHPAWRVTAQGKGKDGMPFDLYAYVDATNGDLLYRDNNVKSDVGIKVVGSVYKTNTLVPATDEPLPDMNITVDPSTNLQLDDNGEITLTGASSATVTFKLSGAWSVVRDASNGGATPQFTTTFAQPSNLYNFPATAPSNSRMVNAYYHVNRIHNYMKSCYPGFTTMDFPLPTNVDVSGTCNAFYNGSSINFYAAGGGCASFAEIGDVVYHEYGHGINDMYYDDIRGSGMRNGGLNEGYADVWALCITQDSILGRNTSGPTSSIRRYDGNNVKVWPRDIKGEVHADGEIIAGAWYDVAKNIGSYEAMGQIFSKTFDDVVDGPNGMEGPIFHDALISALQADDNDANLSNGTPHLEQIVKAFAKHGIYLHYDAVLTHTELAHQPANTPITVSVQLALTNPDFFSTLSLKYRVRGSAWNTVAMTDNGGTFTAQIPAQPMSSILDYYFQVTDAFNIEGNTYPEGFSTDISQISNVTIPYQFAVGVHQRVREDFDLNPPAGWKIGEVSGDNATAGKWVMEKPQRSSYSTNPFGQFISQPGNDHTSGSGSCLVTGNTTSINTYTNRSTSDVDGGSTTVETAPYDLSTYVYPIIEYYRWYANDRGGGQVTRRDDRWRVEMKNETSNWSGAVVENTFQADVNWRRRVFAVYEYLGHAKGVQLRFRAQDANNDSNIEAAIDDFMIYDGVPASVNDVAGVRAEIYPNPADNNVRISMAKAVKGTISINDITGKQIAIINMDGSTNIHNFNTSAIVPGQYMLTIQTEAKTIQSHKIVIAH
jgi:hypothetical protein